MSDGDNDEVRRRLERLRREIEGLGDRHSPDPELQYHLARLASALSAHSLLDLRWMGPHHPRAELLAKVDALIAHTDEVRALAERVREALLRPQGVNPSPAPPAP
jgi:hypothetical protein